MFFFLYQILEKKVGIEQVGLWSVILATSSIITLSNFSLTIGLINFVSQNIIKGDYAKVNNLIFSSFLISLVFYGTISMFLLFFSEQIVSSIVPINMISPGLKIFPYAVFSLFVNSLSGIFISALEGLKKSYLKSIIYIFSNTLFVILCLYMVDKMGLEGAALAQCIQAILILFLSLISLKLSFRSLNLFSYKFIRHDFKEILSFTANYQVISIFQIFFDPLTKILMAKFPGGLALVGNFEMASRLVNQIRSVIISANQVIVPVIAEKMTTVREQISKIYEMNFTFVFGINLLLILPLFGFAAAISKIWIGHYNYSFCICMYIIVIANIINIPSSPAYFSFLGQSKLKPIIVSHVLMGILNLILALYLGWLYEAIGVLISWALAWIIASVYLLIAFERHEKVSIKTLMGKHEILLILLAVFYLGMSFLMNSYLTERNVHFIKNLGFNFILFGILICIPLIFYKRFTDIVIQLKNK